jgi:hypothetical protein
LTKELAGPAFAVKGAVAPWTIKGRHGYVGPDQRDEKCIEHRLVDDATQALSIDDDRPDEKTHQEDPDVDPVPDAESEPLDVVRSPHDMVSMARGLAALWCCLVGFTAISNTSIDGCRRQKGKDRNRANQSDEGFVT